MFDESADETYSNAVYFKDWISTLFNPHTFSQTKLYPSYEIRNLRPTYVILPDNSDGKKFGTIVNVGVNPHLKSDVKGNSLPESISANISSEPIHQNNQQQPLNQNTNELSDDKNKINNFNYHKNPIKIRENRQNNEPEFKNTLIHFPKQNADKHQSMPGAPPENKIPASNNNLVIKNEPKLNSLNIENNTHEQAHKNNTTELPEANKTSNSEASLSNKINIDNNLDVSNNTGKINQRKNYRNREPEFKDTKVHVFQKNGSKPQIKSSNPPQENKPKANNESKEPKLNSLNVNKNDHLRLQSNNSANISNEKNNPPTLTTPNKKSLEGTSKSAISSKKDLKPNSKRYLRNHEPEVNSIKVHVKKKTPYKIEPQLNNSTPTSSQQLKKESNMNSNQDTDDNNHRTNKVETKKELVHDKIDDKNKKIEQINKVSSSNTKVLLEPLISSEQSPNKYEADKNSRKYQRKRKDSFNKTRVTVRRKKTLSK